MDFGHAIRALKDGERVCRPGWDGKGMWLGLMLAEHSEMDRHFIYISSVDGELVPWVASQTDMLAEDWEVIPS